MKAVLDIGRVVLGQLVPCHRSVSSFLLFYCIAIFSSDEDYIQSTYPSMSVSARYFL